MYSFISLPEKISTNFLYFIDISQKSFILAVSAGVTQYFQIKLMQPPQTQKKQENKGNQSFKDEFMKSLQLQMRYGFPVMAFFLAYTIFSGAVALYWTTSNIFSIIHELIVKRKAKKIVIMNNE